MPKLDVLDNIRTASPCPTKWDDMYGDERRRFCEQCERHVYDLSSMHREEASRFLIEHEGSVCVTYYRRSDGRVMTKDCDVGIRIRRNRRERAVSYLGLLGAFVLFGMTAFGVLLSMAQRYTPFDTRSLFLTRTTGALVFRDSSAMSRANGDSRER